MCPSPTSDDPSQPLGLVQRLARTAREAPDRLAFAFLPDGENESERLTFAQLEARVRSTAALLEAEGLAGTRAILLYPSGLDFVVAFLACLRAGVVSAPVPDVAAGREERLLPRLAAVARDARPSAILTIGARLGAAQKLAPAIGAGIEPKVIETDGIAPAEGPADEPGRIDPDATAFLQYTSGSTSSPRGVVISHGNLEYTCTDIATGWIYDGDSLTVSWLPIFHDMGLIVGISVPLHTGSGCLLMPPEAFVKKPLRWLKAISDHEATHSAAPNFAYDLSARKVTEEEKASLDFSSWRVSLNSAEPVREETMRTFAEAFRVCGFKREVFCPGFGLAESTVKVTASNCGDELIVRWLDAAELEQGKVVETTLDKRGLWGVGCGKAILDTEVRMVDPDTLLDAEPGTIAEIWVRSPSVAMGYLDRPDETAKVFGWKLAAGDDTPEKLWMRTGDLGFMDPDGELYCTGRIKDLIVLHGRNVYPQDVERVAEFSAPGLRPGCSTSFSIQCYGEERLFVVAECDPSRGDPEAAADAIFERLGEAMELPVFCVILVPPRKVPKTSSGKVQRLLSRNLVRGLKYPAIAMRLARPAGAAKRGGDLAELLAPFASPGGEDPRSLGLDFERVLELLDAADKAGEPVDPKAFLQPEIDLDALFSGAVQQAAAAPDETVATAAPIEKLDLEDIILSELEDLTGTDTSGLDGDVAFAHFGLDSILSVELAGALEDRFGAPVSATLVWDYPTVASAAAALEKELPAEALAKVAPSGLAAPEGAGRSAASEAASGAATPEPAESPESFDPADLPQGAVAIIGVGCRFPGAHGLDEYWDLLAEGRESVVEITPDRWDVDAWYSSEGADGRTRTRRAGLLDRVDLFDESLFGISSREASRLDPQQRLLLETSWEAFENAGFAPDSLRGKDVGVFVGVGSADYQRIQLSDAESIDAYAATGNAMSTTANRISYVFDLTGPSLAVDTACSSSLVATHIARKALLDDECSLALVGGVNVILSPEWTIAFSQANMMAPDGRCKTFSKDADGYVRGEGCGLVLLERLEDAVANGRNILAVIRGSAIAHGGHGHGLTAPSGPQETRVIERALKSGGVEPSSVDFVEAHGTGTELGDPIELRAMHSAFGSSPEHKLQVGSVKTNIGHLEAAAGVAGLVKAALCLSHGQLVPQLHFTGANPHVDFDALGIEVVQELRDWPVTSSRPTAGVSSFGFGGANAHVVLEAAPRPPAQAQGSAAREDHTVLVSATAEASLAGNATSIATWLLEHKDQDLGDLCRAVNDTRASLAERLSVSGTSHADLAERLAQFGSDPAEGAPFGAHRGHAGGKKPRVLFLFPGQGSQHAGMGLDLAESQPAFRAALEHCAAVLTDHMDRPLFEVLADGEALARTRYAQPAILSVSWSLAELWRSVGVEPAAALGHSVGEVAAACVTGALDIEDGLCFMAQRGALLDALPEGGAMASVVGGTKQFEARLAAAVDATSQQHGTLVIAGWNAPGIATIAGDAAAIEAAAQKGSAFAEDGLRVARINVSHAFHSPHMQPALGDLAKLASAMSAHAPKRPLYSSRTGAQVQGALDASHWSDQLREPVLFAQALAGLFANDQVPVDLVLEVGPHAVCTGFAGRLLRGADAPPPLLSSMKSQSPGWRGVMDAAGGLWTHGVALDFAALDPDGARERVRLAPPRYAFEPRRHWIQLQGEAERTRTALFPTPQHRSLPMQQPSDSPASLAAEVARLFREQNAIIARLAGLQDLGGLPDGLAGSFSGVPGTAPAAGNAPDLALDIKDPAERIRRIVAHVAGAAPERLAPSHVLHRDIGFDSLMAVELDRRLRRAFPALPEGEELFTQDTSLEDLTALCAATLENAQVDDLTEFQRRPREYATYAELIRKDPKDTYVGGTFKAETHELHDISIEGNAICGKLDVINKYSGTASFHLTQMAAYSFVVQLIQGYICHKHGVKKDGIGMPKLNGIHMIWHQLVRTSKDVPARLTELGHTEENGVYVYRFAFDVAEGGVSGEITGFLPISKPPVPAAELSEPATFATHAELIGMDPKDTYTGGTFSGESQDIHHLVCNGKRLTGMLDVQNEWSGTKHFHLTQMGTYSYIVQLMLGYFCYKHGVEKDALGMPTLSEFKIDWTEMVTFDSNIPCTIEEVETSHERGRYTIRFDFTVADPDGGEGGRGFLIGMIPEPGTSAG